jgi:hypothetical protein
MKAINEIELLQNIKQIRELSEFIEVNIKIEDDTMRLSQNDTLKCVEKCFKEEIKTLKIYNMPAESNNTVIWANNQDELLSPEGQTNHQSFVRIGVRILLWLMKHLQPDIANAVQKANKVMDGAKKANWK